MFLLFRAYGDKEVVGTSTTVSVYVIGDALANKTL